MAMVLLGVFALSGCVSDQYSGKGGMTKYSVTDEAYVYHYKNGFTGEDAMGWDPNLQYAWSRAGAALTCGVAMDKSAVLAHMSQQYGQDEMIHEMNGVDYHHMQSKSIADFCTPERLSELNQVIPQLESGQFPDVF